ncbi:MAG: hypothetical protein Q4F65_10730 [Propionibacteriaceae bacterium]|nr:hypothetical protein [Propionibacteriaceae bacterium]
MRWVAGTLAVLVAAVAAFLGWSAWELGRPRSTAAPDRDVWARPASGVREVRLPVMVEVSPTDRLALLEFEDDADPILTGLEPQVIERDGITGFRVLAYRQDGGVDAYDDPALPLDGPDAFRVIGTGLHRHVQVPLADSTFEVDAAGRLHLAFAFTDADGRAVEVTVRETTTRRSVPTNLLAPVGLSSRNPAYFPLFLLNDFEFIRSVGTQLDVVVDGRPVALKGPPVPLPLQGQLRTFAKYTTDPEIIQVFPTWRDEVRVVRTDPGRDVHTATDGVRYLFAGEALERILVNSTEVVFAPPLDTTAPGTGRFTMTSYPDLGAVGGTWAVAVDGHTARLELGIDHVSVPHQRDPLYRLIVNERTFFGTWPTGYRYEAQIDHTSGRVDARWSNDGPD